MKQKLLLAFFALSLLLTSCGSDNGLDGNWIKGSSFEGTPRSGAVSFVIDNEVYVGTGYDGKDALKEFYKYSIQNGWTKIADFPGIARKEAVAFSANGKGYVGTGVDEDDNRLADFYEYEPTSDTWNKITDDFAKEATPSVSNGARQGAVAFSINNVGYVGTGYGYLDDKDRNNLKDFYKFENGIWSKIAFDGEKSKNATAFVIKDKAYVVSGDNSLKYVWEFDPSIVGDGKNGWTRKKYLDKDNKWENVQRSNAVSFVINDKAYISTGLSGGYSREVWEYNPSIDEWVEKTSLELEVPSRENAVAFTLDNRGFFTTGNQSGAYLGDTWEFNPTMQETDKDN